jgi:Fe-S cluster assembly protein SufD
MPAKSKTVVRRPRRSERVTPKDFSFSRDMIPALNDRNTPEKFRQYYENAWNSYLQQSLPTTKDEAWRRTDIRALNVGAFHLPETNGSDPTTPTPKELLQPLVGDHHGGQIAISPAGVQREVDPDLEAAGLIYTELNTAQRNHPLIVERILGKIVRVNEGKFAALAAAMTQNGILVYVPPGMQVELPLHSIIWAPGADLAYFTHLLVYVDEGASLTYVHEAASPTEFNVQTLHAGIVEIHVGRGADLRFVELQSWGNHVWNFSHERARVEQDGSLDWIFGAVGSHLTKNFSDLDLVGQGANGRMSGFYFTDGVQVLDHDTQQNHLAANTTSDLLFKGALKDSSRSVWQGMIYVAPGAQKTDGYQANRNLVLSTKARADSIPGLEILADDVRCTHGATVGKIDADQVFYLRSRGIPYNEAERLIVEGFFNPIMQRIPFEGVRTRFQYAILEKMG